MRELETSALMIVLSALLAQPVFVQARKLEVGPGKVYAKPSAAAAAVQNGDTVEIAPGIYPGDAARWTANNLVLRATGPYAHLRADGVHSGGKGIWVIVGNNVKVENIEFSGAKVPDENGAGIRQEGNNVVISHCYFHDNENGILTDGGNSDIVIEYTEFGNNGLGDGYTHNMYIGNINSFTLRYCYTHHAKIGHNIKSRAAKNFILYNRSLDGADGTASYELDLPNGGASYVIGNVFQQGPNSDNSIIFAYGAEGLSNPLKELYVVNNTFVNDRQGGTFISIAGGATTAKVLNNLFVGSGTPISGKAADTAGNLASNSPGFADKANFDYRLTQSSPAIDKGKPPGAAGDFDLAPIYQYVHPAGVENRPVSGALDAGAFEWKEGTGVVKPRRESGPKRRGTRDGRSQGILFPFNGAFFFLADALGRAKT